MAKRKPLSIEALKAALQADIGDVMEVDSPSADMAVAVVLAAHLEHSLMTMLDRFFVELQCGRCRECRRGLKCNKNDAISGWNGPLDSFSKCCDLAFRLGLINERLRTNLELVGTIRNRFAHHPSPIDFSDREIVAACDKLMFPSTGRDWEEQFKRDSPKMRFMMVAILMEFHFEDFLRSIKRTTAYVWRAWS